MTPQEADEELRARVLRRLERFKIEHPSLFEVVLDSAAEAGVTAMQGETVSPACFRLHVSGTAMAVIELDRLLKDRVTLCVLISVTRLEPPPGIEPDAQGPGFEPSKRGRKVPPWWVQQVIFLLECVPVGFAVSYVCEYFVANGAQVMLACLFVGLTWGFLESRHGFKPPWRKHW